MQVADPLEPPAPTRRPPPPLSSAPGAGGSAATGLARPDRGGARCEDVARGAQAEREETGRAHRDPHPG
ncbi:MAG: hypothetical protein B7Z68_01210 [Acidobacteria bacterium 21-70-11]|nr:MAG: hypothetical protein B7Z68_01210 [Acidobacteria bacterium 21-70-11]OYW06367.1 MAG: hypothetical protein B7Z61_02830 [Acidobacteria bacterium 37-71-11]